MPFHHLLEKRPRCGYPLPTPGKIANLIAAARDECGAKVTGIGHEPKALTAQARLWEGRDAQFIAAKRFMTPPQNQAGDRKNKT